MKMDELFYGKFLVRVDEAGRIIIPSVLRRYFNSSYVLIMNLEDEGDVNKKILDKTKKSKRIKIKPFKEEEHNSFINMEESDEKRINYFSSTYLREMDGMGRINMNINDDNGGFRKYHGLEVVIKGNGDHIILEVL